VYSLCVGCSVEIKLIAPRHFCVFRFVCCHFSSESLLEKCLGELCGSFVVCIEWKNLRIFSSVSSCFFFVLMELRNR
jgi:hypothetical protein